MRSARALPMIVSLAMLCLTSCSDDDTAQSTPTTTEESASAPTTTDQLTERDDLCQRVTDDEVVEFVSAAGFAVDGPAAASAPWADATGWDCGWRFASGEELQLGVRNRPGRLDALQQRNAIVEYEEPGQIMEPGAIVSGHPALSDGVIVENNAFLRFAFLTAAHDEELHLTFVTEDAGNEASYETAVMALADSVLDDLGWIPTPSDALSEASVDLDIDIVRLPVAGVDSDSAFGLRLVFAHEVTAFPDGRIFVVGTADFVDSEIVEQQPLMWTSADGADWRLADIGEDGRWTMVDAVIAGEAGYEAMATSFEGSYPFDERGTIDPSLEYWSSADGVTWTLGARVSSDEPVDERFIETSLWPADIEAPPSECLGGWHDTSRLIDTDDGFVAFCADTDGNAWSREPMGIWELTESGWRALPDPNGVFDEAIFQQVIPTADGYLAIGDRVIQPDRLAAAVWWSEDARIWAPVDLDEEMFGDNARIFDAAPSRGTVVMVGADAGFSRADPVVWSVQPGKE